MANIYDCEQCKKKVKALMLDRVEQMWKCVDCFYKKDEKDNTKSVTGTKKRKS